MNFYEKIPNTYFMPFYRLILSNSSCREAHRQSSRNRAMARQRSRVQAFGHQQAYPAIIQRYGKNPLQLFSQLMEGILKKLERYCATARPILGGEVYLTGEEVCSQLRLSTRTLQEYRNLGTLPFYKIGGKILYKQSDIQTMLERHYNPIPQTGKL